MSYQRGSLKKVKRREGEIWVLRYRVTNSDGRRVENVMPIGLVREFPKDKDARREADRLGLPARINDSPLPGRIHFDFLAEHYLKADFGADSVRPKSPNTISHVEHVAKNPPQHVETRSKTDYKAVIITPAQTLAILKALPSSLHFTLVLTCAATALRASEIL